MVIQVEGVMFIFMVISILLVATLFIGWIMDSLTEVVELILIVLVVVELILIVLVGIASAALITKVIVLALENL